MVLVKSFKKQDWCTVYGMKGLQNVGVTTDFVMAKDAVTLEKKCKKIESHPYFIEWM